MGNFLTEHYSSRWPDTPSYPGVRRLFEALDWENQYHAYYVPLCDSVHTFADDMANIVDLFHAGTLCDEIMVDGMKFIKQEHRRLAIYNFSLATGLRCVSLMNVFSAAGYEEILDEMQPRLEKMEQILIRNDEYDHSRI
ncbi:hypothetical protein [Dickeya dadantii]|uniref:hypothetical protein n=1 Tax=Dickeya dadantii TaxID=204038 RepID=UPI001F392268|nr:hypothetical protein [Dickeya dadantii]